MVSSIRLVSRPIRRAPVALLLGRVRNLSRLIGSAPFDCRYALMKFAWLCSSSALSWMYWGRSLSSTERALVNCLFPLPPGRSRSWIPPSSLYCSHRSASRSSAAARNWRMATSPLVRRQSAEAGDGWASRPLAPMAPTPTAAPLSRNERRFVKRRDGSMSSTIFLLQKLWRATRCAARRYDGPNDASDVGPPQQPFLTV